MIARLVGKLASREEGCLILDVNGVGYEVTVSKMTARSLPKLGDPLTLLIYTAVRENDISLFGFLESAEKEIFEKLLLVSGIGPKLALTILSGIAPQELAASVHREDLVRLTAISGVGKKTAERIIVDLKDKLIAFGGASSSGKRTIPTGNGKMFEDLLSALTNLGYHRNLAERTLSQIPLGELTLESGLRKALKELGSGK
ncbi:MAG: Holliday junction branch migration protein RuvA [bacterium]|nr:Holliday junction branch migration protein RuvA [bacterium]